MKTRKFLGVFVSPDDVQNEGLNAVFENIEAVGADAISISPWISRPVEEGKGGRIPDLHIDGYRRLLDRPLWGKREVYLESFLTYEPDLSLYEQGDYPPPAPSAPPGLDRDIAGRMIAEAKQRDMEVHIEVLPFVPPNVRAEDQPVYVDGSFPSPPQIAYKACLNSPAAITYGLAFIEDTIQNYPDVDGLFIDWAEFSAYLLEDNFACFCPHCQKRAEEQGFDWNKIRNDVSSLWNWLHHLTPIHLVQMGRVAESPFEFVEYLMNHPGWISFLKFKALTVVGFYERTRQLLNDLGYEDIKLSARGWPPPWNRTSGLDFRALVDVCDAMTPKLFTFDHAAMPRWYAQKLLEWNPGLSETAVLDAMVSVMNLPDDIEHRTFMHYQIPAPDELHPARISCYRERLDEIRDLLQHRVKCYPYIHAYGPESQLERMIRMVLESRADGAWVQMYGYLSDRKLEILAELWRYQ